MGLEQYAGMNVEQKLSTLLVKVDNLEQHIIAKPCPSPECVRCRADVAELKQWKAMRTAQLEDEAEAENDKQSREAWVIPMWVSVIVSVGAIVFSLIMGA